MKQSEIKFNITLDEHHIPEQLTWEASDANEKGSCEAVMMSMWDEKEQNTLRIDLWTKDMKVHEMKKFFHQSLLTMADTFERATSEEKVAQNMREFAKDFAEKLGLF